MFTFSSFPPRISSNDKKTTGDDMGVGRDLRVTRGNEDGDEGGTNYGENRGVPWTSHNNLTLRVEEVWSDRTVLLWDYGTPSVGYTTEVVREDPTLPTSPW